MSWRITGVVGESTSLDNNILSASTSSVAAQPCPAPAHDMGLVKKRKRALHHALENNADSVFEWNSIQTNALSRTSLNHISI